LKGGREHLVRVEDLLEVAIMLSKPMTYETSGEGDTRLTTMNPVETVDKARETLATARRARREHRRKVTRRIPGRSRSRVSRERRQRPDHSSGRRRPRGGDAP
jgi:hypothetical protein